MNQVSMKLQQQLLQMDVLVLHKHIQFTVTECDPLVYWVPNTFTPNGDEFNTLWGPVFEGPYDAQDFHLVVLNRWGNLIWESWNAEARWDGTYSNNNVHDGVYTWVIDFGMLDTDERNYCMVI
jgi:gliding motility-associated-like protein